MKKFGWSLIAGLILIHASTAFGAIWLTDFPKAQAKATEEKKLILIDFTGSDWCPPCMALHKNVLTIKEFETFAKDNLILVLADFPKKKVLTKAQQAANEQLAKRFEVKGYPTVVVLDSAGKQLHKSVGYGGATAKEFVAEIEKLKAKKP